MGSNPMWSKLRSLLFHRWQARKLAPRVSNPAAVPLTTPNSCQKQGDREYAAFGGLWLPSKPSTDPMSLHRIYEQSGEGLP